MAATAAHALAPREVERALDTDAATGLSAGEAGRRLAAYGPNRPRQPRRPPYLRLAGKQFVDPLVLLLVAATAVSVASGGVGEGLPPRDGVTALGRAPSPRPVPADRLRRRRAVAGATARIRACRLRRNRRADGSAPLRRASLARSSLPTMRPHLTGLKPRVAVGNSPSRTPVFP
jgi:hypothetical protein